MTEYIILGNCKNCKNVKFATVRTLSDAYEQVVFLGKGTSRRFTIEKVTTEEFVKLTAKAAEYRLNHPIVSEV